MILAVAPGAASASGSTATASVAVTCANVEAGPAGPAGNRLRITDHSVGTILYRNGSDIGVQAFDGPRTLLTCSGAAPTVNNIDRIDYTGTGRYSGLWIDQNGAYVFHPHTPGLLEPGATPEPGGDEIEIHVHRQSAVLIEGRPTADNIELGNRSGNSSAVNLDVSEDGAHPDADVFVPGPRSRTFIRVVGRGGNDRISARGHGPFAGKLTIDELSLVGVDGNDTLLGSPRHDRLSAGTGNDLLRGGHGHDSLTLGPGRDRGFGGPGHDEFLIDSNVGGTPADTAADLIVAGGGPDKIFSDGNGFADDVRCGGGLDTAYVDFTDHRRHCEQVHVR